MDTSVCQRNDGPFIVSDSFLILYICLQVMYLKVNNTSSLHSKECKTYWYKHIQSIGLSQNPFK